MATSEGQTRRAGRGGGDSAVREDKMKEFDLPPLKIWKNFSHDTLRLIETFAKHTHDYCKVFPDGPRDNGEYIMVSRRCGHCAEF